MHAAMHTRDASGRRVSLLNDDDDYTGPSTHDRPRPAYQMTRYMSSASFVSHGRSPSPYPNTPELLRSNSYDSQVCNEPISPITPMHEYAQMCPGEARSPYEDYYSSDPQHIMQKRHAHAVHMQMGHGGDDTIMYDHDSSASTSPPATSVKRYPCRYRETHGCEKTFTTSGHASRHSKIHTAEKAVPCSYPGCAKKFTRADNMKQHLETHYKEKSRSGTVRPTLAAAKMSHAIVKSGRRHRSSLSPAASASPSASLRRVNLGGLDALAMAVACQEGS